MALFKGRQTDKLAEGAREAAAGGRQVLVVALSHRATNPGAAEVLDEWAEQITAVEAEGWTLDRWSSSVGNHDSHHAQVIFRRR